MSKPGKKKRPASSRKRSKAPPRRRPKSTGRKETLRVRWSGLRTMYDFWGQEIKRHYHLETLTQAVERTLAGKDSFLKPSVQQVLGPAPIASISFELFQEGQYQLIFRATCANVRRNKDVFGLVVAKNHEEYTKIARKEHNNLRWLHARAPEFVVSPLRGGFIFLPDRHGRKSHGRNVYAYVTRWLKGYHELGVGKNMQFFINEKRPQSFSKSETEELKSRIIEIIVRSFDPESHRAMAMPEVASGDFVVIRPSRGRPKLKLIACRKLQARMTPAKLLHQIVTAQWTWGKGVFRLAPDDPRGVVQGITWALGRAEARRWLAEYGAALAAGRFRESEALSRSDIDRLSAA